MMVQQVIYSICSKAKRQLRENGQDSAASWENVQERFVIIVIYSMEILEDSCLGLGWRSHESVSYATPQPINLTVQAMTSNTLHNLAHYTILTDCIRFTSCLQYTHTYLVMQHRAHLA